MSKKLFIAMVAIATILFVSCEKEEIKQESLKTNETSENSTLKATTAGWVIYPNWNYSTSGGVPTWKCFAKGSKMVVSVTNNNTSNPVYVTLNYATSSCGSPDTFNSFWVPANQAKSVTINPWGSSDPNDVNLMVKIQPNTSSGTYTGIVTVSAYK